MDLNGYSIFGTIIGGGVLSLQEVVVPEVECLSRTLRDKSLFSCLERV